MPMNWPTGGEPPLRKQFMEQMLCSQVRDIRFLVPTPGEAYPKSSCDC